MTGNIIPDSARSEEHLYDKRFVKRWADRCVEIRQKFGQQAANDFALKFLSKEARAEVNIELRNRFKK